MKKMFVHFVLALACMGVSVSFAAEKTMSPSQKDQCLLISKDCKNATLSIQEKMDKLQAEINKGTRVYTPAELKKLKTKLADVEKQLDNLLKN